MIKPIVLANALATVVGAGYILCRLVAAVAPELLFNVGQSWLHTVNLAPLRTASRRLLRVASWTAALMPLA